MHISSEIVLHQAHGKITHLSYTILSTLEKSPYAPYAVCRCPLAFVKIDFELRERKKPLT